MVTERQGRCLCRAVRFRVKGELRNLGYCHCESCRRATGSAFVAWGTVDASGFEITEGEIAVVRSSDQVERGFCRQCGTTLTYQHAQRAAELDFTLVSLEEPSPVRPSAHIWVQDKLPWVQICDGLPQYATVVEAEE